MDGVHFIVFCHLYDGFNIQIGLQRVAVGPNLIGFVCFVAMEAVAVFVGKNSDRAYF